MPTIWHLSQRISMKIISALVSLAVHWQSRPIGGWGQPPREITAGGSQELIKKLQELLKTDDSEVLRKHIVHLAKAWDVKVRLPAKAKVA